MPVAGSLGGAETFRREMGFQGELDLKKHMGDNGLFTSELDLFSNLEGADQIDVIEDNNISTQISKYFQAAFQYKIVYDHDVSVKRQVKSVLSFGLQYIFL